MRFLEYVISDGEGTLLDHGAFEWTEDNQITELISSAPKGALVCFEEIDPDQIEWIN